MSWVAAAIGGVSAIAGGVQANQNRQRQKGIIGKAYALGQQRMNLGQLDARQRVAEQSGARGLDAGGDVTTGAAVGPGATPGVGGAHTLGAQQTADLAREQTIEQTGLKNESEAQLSNVNEEASQQIINAGVGGIEAGVQAKSGLSALNALKTQTPGTAGATPMASLSGDATSSPYPNSFGGIDPVHPLGRGAWAGPASGSTGGAAAAGSTSDFNVNT